MVSRTNVGKRGRKPPPSKVRYKQMIFERAFCVSRDVSASSFLMLYDKSTFRK